MKITILVLCLLTSGLMATTFIDKLIALGITEEILLDLVEMEVGELLDMYNLDIDDFESISRDEWLDFIEMEVGELLE